MGQKLAKIKTMDTYTINLAAIVKDNAFRSLDN